MFPVIKAATGRAHLYLIGGLILACVALGMALTVTRAEVSVLQANLETASANQLGLQQDVSALTVAVERQEADKAKIWQQITALTVAEQQYRTDLAGIRGRQEALSVTLSEYRSSQDESLSLWMGTAVPDNVQRLLSNAANCAHRNNRGAEACRDPTSDHW
ncbi:hypothetical protein [Shewanella algae]|uniref:hypothetical protein n=1 Tax=Shewanella algae TaxID=38313 RepID=UPI001AADFE2A|nr:hypothetical protein [Shewanella algae]MBO2658127.1 hypothetical protein [Shewanella algae]